MRSKNQKIRQMLKLVKLSAKVAASLILLGLKGKQWLAAALICLILLPVFSLPVSASVRYAPSPVSKEFESVNEKLYVWTEIWRNLNTKFETWATLRRPENVVFANNENEDKKKAGKVKDNKSNEVKPEEAKAQESNDDSTTIVEKDNVTPSDENSVAEKLDSEELKSGESNEISNLPASEENKTPAAISNIQNSSSAPALFNQIPTNEHDSIYTYENNLGAPPGQVEADSSNEAAATRIRHRVGISNFSFGLSLAGLSGRGIDAGVGMTYNSRTWNKSRTPDPNNPNAIVDHYIYDVEDSWVAPGFSSGFGYLEAYAVGQSSHVSGTSNFYYYTEIVPAGLTGSDGTRTQLKCLSYSSTTSRCEKYGSFDGTFIEMKAHMWNLNQNNSPGTDLTHFPSAKFTVGHPDGSKITYVGGTGSGNFRRFYPVTMQDRNGNMISVFYKTGNSGRIDYIRDTLNRQIKFYYENDSNGNPDKLVAVTIPGMNANQEIQTIRFYYETINLNATGAFVGQVTAPTTIRVLRYVYMPTTKTGYKYDYHPNFGMIQKITKLVGMQVNGSSYTSTGSVVPNSSSDSNSGLWAATTEYNYESATPALNDVPKYTMRTDDWQGRTSSQPQKTYYNSPEPEVGGDLISQITVEHNGFNVMTESRSHHTGDWKRGLLKETSVKRVATGSFAEKVMAKTVYHWAQTSVSVNNRSNQYLDKTETTNEAGLTRKTEFDYDIYNNPTEVREYDYEANLLRTIKTEYVTDSDWINARLIRLAKKIEVVVDGITVSKSLLEYDHNGSDALLVRREDIDESTHNDFYNPDRPSTCVKICPDQIDVPCSTNSNAENGFTDQDGCVTQRVERYSSDSAYRGNVTKVTSFSDATLASDPNADVKNINYDIAGNPVSATLSCCNEKLIGYDKANEYAFPVSETKGTGTTQLISSFTYNRNTGLPLTSTNANGQVTNFEYDPDTLRQKKVISPNGAYTETEYSDELVTNPTDLLPGFVRTTTTLEANKTVQSYSYYDGRGLGIRSASETPDGWSISAIEYDRLGRAVKSYNPFYGTTPIAAIPSNTKFTEVAEFDALGRATEMRMQDNTTVQGEFGDATTTPANFNKTFVVATDQAGKKRRQIADALGRIIRVDEPDKNTGSLGSLTAPAQPTHYEYDANDNLSKVIQTDGSVVQERLFKYDSLSRLTHERQVEANATLNDNGVWQTSGGSWTKVLKYNLDGLLAEGTDARGVKTTFSYDGLNRVKTLSYSDGTPKVKYTYDQERTGFFNNGVLTRVETELEMNSPARSLATATEFDYDQMGRVVKHRQTIGNQIYPMEYGYNQAGQLTSEKYPSGRTIAVNYDAKGRLANIADQSRTYLNGLQYQGNGNSLNSMTFGNGTTQSFTMNDRLQMTRQELKRGSEVLQRYDYGYGQIDANGNLDITKNNGQLARLESHIGTAKQWTQKFSYDALGRLSEAKEHRGDNNNLSYKQNFDYDNFGNLYRKNSSNPVTGQETPIAFTPIEAADINKSTNRFASQTTYDDAGNVIVDSKFRTSNFSYDANGRMIKATRANVPDATSVYDASGMRVAEKVNDIWRFLIYDIGGKLIAEYGGISGNDEGGVKYLCTDWQGSTRAVLNNSGYVQARMDYTAFGEDISNGTGIRTTAQGFNVSNNLRQKYGLTERDEATGLDHTWFRKNEQKAGRWTSPDPYNGSMILGNPQSFNRYSYVENQPTNFVDPSGLQLRSFDVRQGMSCVFEERDGKFHCTEFINRYWYDDGIGSGGDGGGGIEFGGGGGIIKVSSGGRSNQENNVCDDLYKESLSKIQDIIYNRYGMGGRFLLLSTNQGGTINTPVDGLIRSINAELSSFLMETQQLMIEGETLESLDIRIGEYSTTTAFTFGNRFKTFSGTIDGTKKKSKFYHSANSLKNSLVEILNLARDAFEDWYLCRNANGTTT